MEVQSTAQTLRLVTAGNHHILPSEQEREFLAHLIMDAIDNYRRPKTDRRQKEASVWLFHETNVGPPSFVWICETLNLDVDYMRGRIKQSTLRPPSRVVTWNRRVSRL